MALLREERVGWLALLGAAYHHADETLADGTRAEGGGGHLGGGESSQSRHGHSK